MEILPWPFKILCLCGLWSENMSFSFLKSIYKYFVSSLVIWYTLSHLIKCFISSNSEEAKNGIFISAPYIAISLKIVNYIVCSKEIHDLRNKFYEKISQTNSPKEWEILENYTRENTISLLKILIFTLMAGSSVLITPVLNKGIETFTLPLVTYQPYPISNWVLYSFTYAWQVVGSYYGILIQVSSDMMAYGFVSLICAEYDIFCLRLMEIGKNNEIILMKNYIDHHVSIQELINATQAFFMRTVLVLFCCSLLTLSGSIFNAIQVSIISADFVSMVAYFGVMCLQLFLYCWYGNKLTLKSQSVADAIYNSDWMQLDSVQRKGLRFIMLVSSKGNILSHRGQCALNLNTFVWIIKASYTALNVLQHSIDV